MRSHTFSTCCMVPLMSGNICSACNRQAEPFIEITTDSPEGFEFNYKTLPVIPAVTVSSVETNQDHFKVTYNDQSGLQIDHIAFDDVIEWGRKRELWSPVFVNHHFDEDNNEDYTSIWSWRPYQEVEIPAAYQDMEISLACIHMNLLRKEQFIKSVHIKFMEEYLCQLQRHKVES